jgi:hypothetical protein
METMNFGKHKGELVSLVPTDYLIWCVDNMKRPPKIVIAELERRASLHGTRDAVAAASAVSAVAFQQARPKTKRGSKRRQRPEKPRLSRQERLAQRRRAQATARLDRIQAHPVVGEDFDRLRLAFTQADGDEEGCPFDTPDDLYTGPSLAYSGGRWNIVPSEFPPEFF